MTSATNRADGSMDIRGSQFRWMGTKESGDTHRLLLGRWVRDSAWFMSALKAARSLKLADWCIGAGVLRNLVWDHLHDHEQSTVGNDIDLAYFDPSDLSRDRDIGLENQLDKIFPGRKWDVVNQAGVHLWYPRPLGQKVEPFGNLADALATWPEYATCVGIRLEQDDTLTILAPHGLEDLFGLIVRHNPSRITPTDFRNRLTEKRFEERWPLVKIVQ